MTVDRKVGYRSALARILARETSMSFVAAHVELTDSQHSTFVFTTVPNMLSSSGAVKPSRVRITLFVRVGRTAVPHATVPSIGAVQQKPL